MIKGIVAAAGVVVAIIGVVVGASKHVVTLPASSQAYNCGSAWSPTETPFGSIERICGAALEGLNVTAYVLVGIGGFTLFVLGFMVLAVREVRKAASTGQ